MESVDLNALGLTAGFVRNMTEGPDNLRSPLTPTREASLRDDPACLALRLLLCAEPLPRTEAAATLGRDLLDRLLARGILLESDGQLSAPYHLRIVRGLYLFSDYLGSHPDGVMGAGETTAILYEAARPSRRMGSVLDLGCGAGTLALLLAREADHVVATDVNPRAVEFARLNVEVNGIGNVTCKLGSLYEPVVDGTFDLIVSQPPYYPLQSGQRLTFLHAGARGDELAMQILDRMPVHLTPQGRGLIFTSWPAGHQPLESPDLRVLELTTNRREVHGTRQSITILEHAPEGAGWTASYEVPADSWGHVRSRRIEQLLETEDILRGHALAVGWKIPEGAVEFEEGSDRFLRLPPESLGGLVPIDEPTWELLTQIRQGRQPGALTPLLERAVRRGLLAPVKPAPD